VTDPSIIATSLIDLAPHRFALEIGVGHRQISVRHTPISARHARISVGHTRSGAPDQSFALLGILYEMCFNSETFWQQSLLHSMIFTSDIGKIGW
jgi:hypothetical protein